MSAHNRELSQIFNQMASIYRYLGTEDRFRALAYQKAARTIGGLQEDISDYARAGTLENIPGIGEGIAEKIQEYLNTGKIAKYEELRKQVPHGLMDMLEITGFGPKSLKQIHDQLDINSKDELIEALHDGRVAELEGFGAKKVENMLRGLKLHKVVETRMLLWDALEAGESVLEWLRKSPNVINAELAGSLRRRKDTIGDIDILASCHQKHRKKIVKQFIDSPLVKEVLLKGDTKASIILKDTGRQVDLRLVNEHEWGSALVYFTGSKEHNIHLRTLAKDKGYKISEYGVFKTANGKRIAGKTEKDVYRAMGFEYIPPEMREDKGEIELAAKKRIPSLVTLDDIRGDLQMHSNWSDGSHTIQEIAEYVLKNYPYKYISITDHSKSSRIAGGMDEKELLEQMDEVRPVNKKLGKDFLKLGVEVDILATGKLDLSEEILEQLDWVAAAIHSGFKGDQTDRLIKACEHPLVCCIGHPTGRLIGSREPYTLDLEALIKAAKETHTALEINAQPQRMDLNDDMARSAREQGAMLVISTDSHQMGQFAHMKLGVAIARRAWCTKDDILNTGSWKAVKRFIRKKRKALLTHAH